MSTIELLPHGALAVAWQGSSGIEGASDQSIYFSTGRTADPSTWSQPRVAVPPFQGKYAVWGPVLHYAEDARELWLFYSRSGAFNSRGPGRNYPGGDVMLSTSSDGGMSWSSARVIYAFASAARGNASKVTANKLAKLADGTLLLPVWSEVHVATNTGASCAHVLRSTDNGATWTPHACLQNPDTWLIENSLAPTADGRVYQVFRTSVGKLYASKSVDRSGEQWPNATATALLNPNSKTFLFALDGDAGLVLAYNPSSSARTPLALAVSRDSGATFTEYVTLDDGGVGSFAYPTSAQVGAQVWTTYSADTKTGIRLAVTATPSLAQ